MLPLRLIRTYAAFPSALSLAGANCGSDHRSMEELTCFLSWLIRSRIDE
ncbi:Uncharacterised protein [Mycobacteroides abscessus subsp. massiliense]|nr:Uncharacterised protein [Mycobacteroides abscessus subsp. massiliense]